MVRNTRKRPDTVNVDGIRFRDFSEKLLEVLELLFHGVVIIINQKKK